MELEYGLFENDNCHEDDQCVVISRVISDVENCIEDDGAEEFIDLIGGKPRRIRRNLQQKINGLRDDEIPEMVGIFIISKLSPVFYSFLLLIFVSVV